MGSTSAVKPAFKFRNFITSRYLPSQSGRLEPHLPSNCPEFTSTERSNCDTKVKGWVERKCGPEIPLMVCFCSVHQGSFRVYPLGWAPYVRQIISGLSNLNDDLENPYSFFSAAIDGNSSKKWPVYAVGLKFDHYPATFKTQKRQLEVLESLFCLSQKFTDEDRWKTFQHIGADVQALNDLAGGIRDGPTWLSRAKAIYAVLISPVAKFNLDLRSILNLGFRQGIWGNARISMI